MAKQRNNVWRFLASVRLALFALIILAVVSILGTIIKQGRESAFYVQEYGPAVARFLETAQLTSMYSSWWFSALLGLFAANLTVCSIERLPGVWRAVKQDNLSVDRNQLTKMSFVLESETSLSIHPLTDQMRQVLATLGWKNLREIDNEGSTLLFAQKGAWTRLGVYIVHLSILVVLLGALLGNFFGYKAFVYIPEGRSANSVFLQKNREPVPLGFELKNQNFDKIFYPNGMVKQYRVDLAVLDPEKNVSLEKSVIVNDPLSHRGLNFYVGDAFPIEEYLVNLKNLNTGQEQGFRVPVSRDVPWQGTGLSFRITDLKKDLDNFVTEARIQITQNPDEPTAVWVDNEGIASFTLAGERFSLAFKQFSSVLLLVTKDPGVLVVYFGCFVMVAGLLISFLLSHRKIWVVLEPKGKRGTQVLISGMANKNKPAFERHFQEITRRFFLDERIFPPEKKSKKK